MSKCLLVGDPHGKISNVKDFERFLDQLKAIVIDGEYDKVIVLGDLFDSFAVIRSEIMALWTRFLVSSTQSSQTQFILLVGNHDMAGETGGSHSLEPFRYFQNVVVVDQLTLIDGAYYIPFMRDSQEFEKQVREIPEGSVLFAHQSFNGARFGNGFFDPHGADPESVKHLSAVISGHIHTEQKLGNIWYPGTPYQMTFADAGEFKGVFEIDLTEQGYNLHKLHHLDMPSFLILEGSIGEVLEKAKLLVESEFGGQRHRSLKDVNIKVVSTGSPQEIAEFWKDVHVKSLRSLTRRLVDSLTTVKAERALPGLKAKTQKEKLREFILSKQWRTDADKLVDSAEECLNQQS